MTNEPDSVGAAPKRRRISRSVSLSVLMLLIVFVGLWLARETNRARTQRRALEVIWDSGGAIVGNDELDEDGLPYQSKGYNAIQRSLMRVLGDDYIRRPRWVLFDPPGPPFPEQRRLDEKGWKALTVLPDLTILSFDGFIELDDAHLRQLRRLPRLRRLDLIGNEELTDDSMARIAELSQLWTLRLELVPIGDRGLSHLKKLSHLRLLDLQLTRITDAGLVHLTSLKELEELNLRDSEVSDAGIIHLKRMPRLRSLKLTNSQVSSAGIAELKRANPKLKIIP